MISVVRTKSSQSQCGFTLLEMIVVLGLIALLLTFVFVAYNPDSDADKMKKATVELEALSARGHTMAVLHQRPFWLRFERDQVILQGSELPSASRRNSDEDTEDDEEQSFIVDHETYRFPAGMKVLVRRWGAAQDDWFFQERPEDPVIFWNFNENGICEPLSLRMEIEESWVVLEMDPLTALVGDETSEIYD